MQKRIDTVVIGAGQSGLAASYLLGERRVEHVVLERYRIGESWRSKRCEVGLLYLRHAGVDAQTSGISLPGRSRAVPSP